MASGQIRRGSASENKKPQKTKMLVKRSKKLWVRVMWDCHGGREQGDWVWNLQRMVPCWLCGHYWQWVWSTKYSQDWCHPLVLRYVQRQICWVTVPCLWPSRQASKIRTWNWISKRETHSKFSQLDSEYEAMREDLKTLNNKIDDGLKQCKVDSDKLVKSIQHQTRNEIKEEIEEVKATSLEDIMREEMEKSLGNMASEIDSVRCNLNETRAKADKQRDKESRRNNVVFL